MNVQPGQEVDVNILQHDTDYVKPKAKYKPFGGQGQRLGSPTPGPGPRAAPAAATATAATETGPEKPSIDESQPTVTLQIRLGDGSRLSARFNTSNTIGDVYDFVMRANPANRTRSWVLMTTFPSTELKDKGVALGDLQEFRRGGVVVQKWT
jgi:UBX domain-containing protein 1